MALTLKELQQLRVAAAPTPGQGLALDMNGWLPLGVAAQALPILTADPASPAVGQIWMRSTGSLSFRLTTSSTVRVYLS